MGERESMAAVERSEFAAPTSSEVTGHGHTTSTLQHQEELSSGGGANKHLILETFRCKLYRQKFSSADVINVILPPV